MAKRPNQSKSKKMRPLIVLVLLAAAAIAVWAVTRSSDDGPVVATETDSTLGTAPRPLDVGGGPTVQDAAVLDVPPDSLASAGPDAPQGVNVSNDPRKGNRNAVVTIVEFSDFQCPFCARFHTETFPALERLYGDQVQWIFVNRFFSGSHPMAERAALAGECAHRQDRFWDYAMITFQQQDQLSTSKLEEHGRTIGLDMDAFSACLASGETVTEAAADMLEGDRLEVNATPTFFVNGRRVVGAQPIGVFNELLAPYFSR